MAIMTRRKRQDIVEPTADPVSLNDDAGVYDEDNEHEDDDSDHDRPATFTFDNKTFYGTYQEMVKAKRERNREMLARSGLLEASSRLKDDMLEENSKKRASAASKRGLKRVKDGSDLVLTPSVRRKSNRLAGVKASGFYVENESGGKMTIGGGTGAKTEKI
eukprot:9771814-Ditylum_brightwellii.AAC.1